MEVSQKEKSSVSANLSKSTPRLQRYPLRSGTKSKEEKPPLGDSSNSSVPGSRGRTAASVSKSVGILDLSVNSCKEKSAKPPRRLSIPTKSSANSASKPMGSITPISEASRSKKATGNQGRTGTPRSDASKSLLRKFNGLTSASYWQSLIKLSESATKHSVSLGFFKLALEFGCEPLQLLRDELKLYVRHHNLAEFGDTIKELFEGYNISENIEQLQVSETCSHVPEEEIQSSDDDARSSSSLGGSQKPKINPSSNDAPGVDQIKDTNKEKTKKIESATRVRRSVNKDTATSKSGPESAVAKTQRKPQKPRKQGSKNYTVKKQAKESADAQGPLNSRPAEKELQENKENMDAVQTEEMSLSDV